MPGLRGRSFRFRACRAPPKLWSLNFPRRIITRRKFLIVAPNTELARMTVAAAGFAPGAWLTPMAGRGLATTSASMCGRFWRTGVRTTFRARHGKPNLRPLRQRNNLMVFVAHNTLGLRHQRQASRQPKPAQAPDSCRPVDTKFASAALINTLCRQEVTLPWTRLLVACLVPAEPAVWKRA